MTGVRFESEQQRLKIQSLGFEKLKNKNVSSDAIKLGELYRKQIENHYLPNLSVRLVDTNVGYGGFAEEKITTGSYVGEYTGLIRENIRIFFAPLNDYLMEYPVPDTLGRSFVIDAEQGNLCRFFNHSNQPNLKTHYAFIDGFYHAIFLSIKEIEVGDQLTYDYGENYWTLRGAPVEL